MKRIVIISTIILLILAAGAYFVFSQEAKQITNYPGAGIKIVAFGDSLIQGVGASGKDTTVVSVLSRKISREIVNEGIGGNTTRDGLERIDAMLKKYDPKLVILLFGGNDALRKIPHEETFKNLGMMIEKIHNSGSMVLLLGIQGGFLRDPYKEDFEKLARTYNVAYVPSVLKGILGKKEYMFDTIHPNDAGYIQMAEKIYPELEKLVKIRP
ncbi:MAG: GDSL-type esterase/lipase family protein [bacterium]|nr:GDSL-type esterase/lipase family protein [bacterium]